MINILIRHKEGREEMLQRCLESVLIQTYKNIEIHISVEAHSSGIVPESEKINYHIVTEKHYNLYCNDLKHHVESGWMLYIDDDDALAGPDVLQKLSDEIINNYPWKGAYIGRFLRNGKPKPPMSHMRQGIIQKGFIGGGCCVLHHSFKDCCDWQAVQAADYLWIKDLQATGVPMKFIDLVIQKTFNNGLHGK